MKPRRTIHVDGVKALINDRIAVNENRDPAVRQELIYVLEEILHRTGNYRGFQYLGKDEVPAGHKPGINWEPELFDNYDTRFKDTDPTRVRYY